MTERNERTRMDCRKYGASVSVNTAKCERLVLRSVELSRPNVRWVVDLVRIRNASVTVMHRHPPRARRQADTLIVVGNHSSV